MKVFNLKSDSTDNCFSIFLQKQEEIKFIKYGSFHIIVVTKRDEVFVCGSNRNGALGLGDSSVGKINEFIKLNNSNINGKILFLECGYYFTLIVNQFNEFYLTGLLKRDTEFHCKEFTLLKYLNWNVDYNNEKIKLIRCGYKHLFILTEKNKIYGIGSNTDGQLGLEASIPFTKISQINLNLKIKDIQCGYVHSILLDNNGNIYTTGYNDKGQLGLNDKLNRYSFTKINLPFKINKISSSSNSSFFINEFGELFGTGYNYYGDLGVGDCTDRLVFTKINTTSMIDNIYKTNGYYFIYTTLKNEIYVTGRNFSESLGIKKQFCKVKEDIFYYLDSFIKVDDVKIMLNEKIYPILLFDTIYLLVSDEEINVVDSGYCGFGERLFLKAFNKQLVDLEFK